jgi:hypothetical protein
MAISARTAIEYGVSGQNPAAQSITTQAGDKAVILCQSNWEGSTFSTTSLDGDTTPNNAASDDDGGSGECTHVVVWLNPPIGVLSIDWAFGAVPSDGAEVWAVIVACDGDISVVDIGADASGTTTTTTENCAVGDLAVAVGFEFGGAASVGSGYTSGDAIAADDVFNGQHGRPYAKIVSSGSTITATSQLGVVQVILRETITAPQSILTPIGPLRRARADSSGTEGDVKQWFDQAFLLANWFDEEFAVAAAPSLATFLPDEELPFIPRFRRSERTARSLVHGYVNFPEIPRPLIVATQAPLPDIAAVSRIFAPHRHPVSEIVTTTAQQQPGALADSLPARPAQSARARQLVEAHVPQAAISLPWVGTESASRGQPVRPPRFREDPAPLGTIDLPPIDADIFARGPRSRPIRLDAEPTASPTIALPPINPDDFRRGPPPRPVRLQAEPTSPAVIRLPPINPEPPALRGPMRPHPPDPEFAPATFVAPVVYLAVPDLLPQRARLRPPSPAFLDPPPIAFAQAAVSALVDLLPQRGMPVRRRDAFLDPSPRAQIALPWVPEQAALRGVAIRLPRLGPEPTPGAVIALPPVSSELLLRPVLGRLGRPPDVDAPAGLVRALVLEELLPERRHAQRLVRAFEQEALATGARPWLGPDELVQRVRSSRGRLAPDSALSSAFVPVQLIALIAEERNPPHYVAPRALFRTLWITTYVPTGPFLVVFLPPAPEHRRALLHYHPRKGRLLSLEGSFAVWDVQRGLAPIDYDVDARPWLTGTALLATFVLTQEPGDPVVYGPVQLVPGGRDVKLTASAPLGATPGFYRVRADFTDTVGRPGFQFFHMRVT